jgi:lysophospholipase L1-like esterase
MLRSIDPTDRFRPHSPSGLYSARLIAAIGLLMIFATYPPFAKAEFSRAIWTPTWSMASHPSDVTFKNQTIRMIVHTSVGGHQVRIRLTNQYGTSGLSVGTAHIALRKEASNIVPGTDRALTFGGQSTIVIPPGAYALSDPVDLDVPQLADLAISVYVVDAPSLSTAHNYGLKTNYISPGDVTGAPDLSSGAKTRAYYWLTEVYVTTQHAVPVIVAFGDSITDGFRATPDADSSYPSVLGKMLLTQSRHPAVVLNEGIGGNRVLHDNLSFSALARFDRDALDQPALRIVILLDGTNDIIGSTSTSPGSKIRPDISTPSEIIQGLQQIVARCRLYNIKVIGMTLAPYGGSKYYLPDGDNVRKAVNQWIRTSGVFDAVLDLDKLMDDPAHPGQFLPAYDGGDRLHPGDAGYQAMANAAFQIVERLEK